MAKYEELKGSDLIVIEIPAKMGVVNNTIIEDVPTKRAAYVKSYAEKFVLAKEYIETGREPKVLGTPNGVDENGLLIAKPFDTESAKKVKD